jgi:hypothetical protein
VNLEKKKGVLVLLAIAAMAYSLFHIAPPNYHSYIKEKKAHEVLVSSQDQHLPVGLRSAFQFSGFTNTEGTFHSKVSTQTAAYIQKIQQTVIHRSFVIIKEQSAHIFARIDLPTKLLKLLI